MTEIALYGRTDGLFEPRTDKGIEISKKNAGKLVIGSLEVVGRSKLQNRYLNGWVYTKQIVKKLNDSGQSINGVPWTRDILHAVFQDQFLVKFECVVEGRDMGIDVKVYESTAAMSKKRFTEYINEQITPFVWEMWEISIDDPREGYWREVMREIER